ncbi:hypothetical protein B0H16DRAFT_1378380, partial [Mycena metata]
METSTGAQNARLPWSQEAVEGASLVPDHSRIEIEDALQTKAHSDASTYPVLTLPAKLVSEIFIHFLPAYPKRPPIKGVLSPFTLGQICRTWRDIALSMPRLWRAVEMF